MMATENLTLSLNKLSLQGNRRRGKTILLSLALSMYAAGAFAQATPAPQGQTSPATQEAAPQGQAAPATQEAAPASPVQPQQPAAAPSATDTQTQPPAPASSTTPAEQPAPVVENQQPVQPSLATAEEQASGSPQQRTDIPHNLSPWGMFMAADWVVKGVMIGLAFASLITWTVWVAKTIELAGARIRAGSTLKIVHKAKTLSEATDAVEKKGGPAALMLRMATHEMHLSDAVVDHTDGGGIKERVSSVLSRIETHAGRRMSRGTGALATIGSTAPFVGLFGTVWGIMNSFISISESQTTNLAVVAPGIAEALLATAIGLVAAIPAVVIYNVFARSITGYRHLLADVAAGVERLVSRDLDFRRIPPGTSVKPAVSLVGR